MADYGTVTLLGKGKPLITASNYQATARANAYPAVVILPKRAPIVLSDYRLAGTLDVNYHPPTVGQLWPRGDLDAE